MPKGVEAGDLGRRDWSNLPNLGPWSRQGLGDAQLASLSCVRRTTIRGIAARVKYRD